MEEEEKTNPGGRTGEKISGRVGTAGEAMVGESRRLTKNKS